MPDFSQLQASPHIQTEVPAGATNHETTWEVPQDATLHGITVWAVPGSQDALELQPVVREHLENDRYRDEPIPEYPEGGEEFITGEPDDLRLGANIGVEDGDEIVVKADNRSAKYAYRYRVTARLSYTGGDSPLPSGMTRDGEGDTLGSGEILALAALGGGV